MRRVLLTLSTLLVSTSLFATEHILEDSSLNAFKSSGAALDLQHYISQKIEKEELRKQTYIDTKNAPLTLWRTSFNALAAQDEIEINGITFKLANGITKEQFVQESMPNAKMFLSNTFGQLTRKGVEERNDESRRSWERNYFLITYDYTPSPFDAGYLTGKRYEIQVEANLHLEYSGIKGTIDRHTLRQTRVSARPDLALNRDVPDDLIEYHSIVRDFIAENKQLFEQSCQLLFELSQKKNNSTGAEDDYVELSERVFELRDTIDFHKDEMITLIRNHLEKPMSAESLEKNIAKIKEIILKKIELTILPFCKGTQ